MSETCQEWCEACSAVPLTPLKVGHAQGNRHQPTSMTWRRGISTLSASPLRSSFANSATVSISTSLAPWAIKASRDGGVIERWGSTGGVAVQPSPVRLLRFGRFCRLTDFSPRKAENLERGYLQGRYGAIPFLEGQILDEVGDRIGDGGAE